MQTKVIDCTFPTFIENKLEIDKIIPVYTDLSPKRSIGVLIKYFK